MNKTRRPSPLKTQTLIREVSDNGSIAGDKEPLSKTKYPLPGEKEKREKDQPEFIYESPNRRKSK